MKLAAITSLMLLAVCAQVAGTTAATNFRSGFTAVKKPPSPRQDQPPLLDHAKKSPSPPRHPSLEGLAIPPSTSPPSPRPPPSPQVGILTTTVVIYVSTVNTHTNHFKEALLATRPFGVYQILNRRLFKGTVFVPNDEAFEAFAANLGMTFAEVLQQPSILAEVLQFHIVPTTALAFNDLLTKSSLPTNLGQNIKITHKGTSGQPILVGGLAVNNASIVQGDQQIGVVPNLRSYVHIIDTVLVPSGTISPSAPPSPPSPSPPPFPPFHPVQNFPFGPTLPKAPHTPPSPSGRFRISPPPKPSPPPPPHPRAPRPSPPPDPTPPEGPSLPPFPPPRSPPAPAGNRMPSPKPKALPPNPPPPLAPGTTQVLRWSEEFEHCGPNTALCQNGLRTQRWFIKYGAIFGHYQCYGNNSEILNVEPNPSNTSDGILTMRTKYNPNAQCYDPWNKAKPMNYDSARLETQNKVSFMWTGPPENSIPVKIEARMRLPVGYRARGLWPAFWMEPQGTKWGMWCSSGEIDIMEHGQSNTGTYSGTLNFGGSMNPDNKTTNNVGCKDIPASFKTQDQENHAADNSDATWHVFGVIWASTYITFTIDDIPYQTVTMNRWFSALGGAPYAPYDQPFFIILSCAVGVGNIAPFLDASNPIQTCAEVDWIRVWDMYK